MCIDAEMDGGWRRDSGIERQADGKCNVMGRQPAVCFEGLKVETRNLQIHVFQDGMK